MEQIASFTVNHMRLFAGDLCQQKRQYRTGCGDYI